MNAPSEKELIRIRARKAEAEVELLVGWLLASGVSRHLINEARQSVREATN